VADVFGKRNQECTDELVREFKKKTDCHKPLFVTDGRDEYAEALLREYGICLPVEKTGKRGRPRKPRLIAPPGLNYVQVVKHRRKGRVIKIEKRLVFGTWEAVNQVIKESPVSNAVNVAFVENTNLISRHYNRRLTRKTISFSKKKQCHVMQYALFKAYYHLVKPHKGLRVKEESGRRRWRQRTPLMSAGITDHIWSMSELFHYRNPR